MADSQHPEVVSKLKAMGKETKTEEKEIQHALKDIHSTEKADVKASKAAEKVEKDLGKKEKSEQSTLQAANKAAHRHDIAAADLAQADKDLKLKQEQSAKLHHQLEVKKARADELVQQKEHHDQIYKGTVDALDTGGSAAGAAGPAVQR